MMLKSIKNNAILYSVGLLFIVSCGSAATTGTTGTTGTTSTTTQTRTTSGAVATTAVASIVSYATTNPTCVADTVIATNSKAETVTASVDATDCSFSIDLPINKSYSVSFTLNDQFVATLLTNTSATTTSNVFKVSDAATDINLGTVSFTGSTASPEIEPAEQNDEDGDGISDYEDNDDDDDGIDDLDEVDCDGDGFEDDDDQSDASCDDSGDSEDGSGDSNSSTDSSSSSSDSSSN